MIEGFKKTDYPEAIGCYILPSLDDRASAVEIRDWDDNVTVLDVPSAAVHIFDTPKIGTNNNLSPDALAAIGRIFEASIGLGTVACRIVRSHEDLLAVEVPTMADKARLTVPRALVVRATRRK